MGCRKIMDVSDEFKKFVAILTGIEQNREFDRKVDRLKKSSSAVTVWAVIPGIFGIYGISHFYLNRPIDGLLILILGLVPSLFIGGLFTLFTYAYYPLFPNWIPNTGLDTTTSFFIFTVLRLGFFVGNIISARYHYSQYDFYIHLKGKKPWNNWGLDSLV